MKFGNNVSNQTASVSEGKEDSPKVVMNVTASVMNCLLEKRI